MNRYYLVLSTIALTFACVERVRAQAEVQFVPGTPAQVATPGFDSALVLGASSNQVTIYPGATLDLTDGGLIVDAANFTCYVPNLTGGYVPESGTLGINDAIANMAGGLIQGTGAMGDETSGIFTSNTGAADFIGWVNSTATNYTTWRGVDLSQQAIKEGMVDPIFIGDAYPGDLFLAGTPATSADLSIINANITSGKTNTTWQDGDINYQGSVDSNELSVIQSVEGLPALYQVTPVPEPTTLTLLVAAGLIGIVRFRRRAENPSQSVWVKRAQRRTARLVAEKRGPSTRPRVALQ